MTGQTTNTGAETVRIIIVDDHPVVREGMRVLLSHEVDFDVCSEAGNAADALALIASASPHLAIVDVLLDGESGLDLIQSISTCNETVRVLACSMFDDRLYAERTLAAGAMGYINKRAGISKIIEAVRRVMAGQVYLSDEMKQDIIRRTTAKGPFRQASSIEALSNREVEIFRSIGHGMTMSQIAGQLKLSVKTVEKHRQKLKRRLQIENTAQLAREAAHWLLENG